MDVLAELGRIASVFGMAFVSLWGAAPLGLALGLHPLVLSVRNLGTHNLVTPLESAHGLTRAKHLGENARDDASATLMHLGRLGRTTLSGSLSSDSRRNP